MKSAPALASPCSIGVASWHLMRAPRTVFCNALPAERIQSVLYHFYMFLVCEACMLHPHYNIFWKPPTTFVSWTARGLCKRSGIWLMKCGIFQWNGCKLIWKTILSNWQSSAVCPFLSWNFKPSFGTITPVILIPAQVRRGQINALSTNRKYTD